MTKSYRRQLGVSLSGLLFWCVLIGAVALIAMKLFPLYNEKMKVDFAFEEVLRQPDLGNWNKTDIVTAMMKQFEISDVDRWSTSEFTKLLQVAPKPGGGRTMALEYEIRGPLCCDLDVVLNYHRESDLPRGTLDQ